MSSAPTARRLVTVPRSEAFSWRRHLPILLGLSGASTAQSWMRWMRRAAWPIDSAI